MINDFLMSFSYPKISITQALFISILLIVSLYGCSLFKYDYPLLAITFTIVSYLVLIMYSNKFVFNNVISGTGHIDRPFYSILLISIVGICFFCIVYSIQLIASALIYGETFTAGLETYTKGFKTTIFSILVFPLLEELLFRKSILRGLNQIFSKSKSIFISAIMFSLAHLFTDTGIFFSFLIGMMLGYIYIKYKSFILVFVVHTMYNSLVIFISPIINNEIFAIKLSKIYMLSIPVLVVSLVILLLCFYLLNIGKIIKDE